MNRAELEQDVVRKIGDGDNPDDVILMVCHRTGWQWPQAEAFVEGIAFYQQKQIQNRRLGLRWIMMLFILVGGIGLIFISGLVLLLPMMSRWRDLLLHPFEMMREIGLSMVMVYSTLTLGISMVVGAVLSGLRLIRNEEQ